MRYPDSRQAFITSQVFSLWPRWCSPCCRLRNRRKSNRNKAPSVRGELRAPVGGRAVFKSLFGRAGEVGHIRRVSCFPGLLVPWRNVRHITRSRFPERWPMPGRPDAYSQSSRTWFLVQPNQRLRRTEFVIYFGTSDIRLDFLEPKPKC